MTKKVLIVGGVAGGASVAARLRRLDENAEIIMFERDGYISFANCGLPYYIGGSIKERDHLLVQTPEGMKNRFNIDVRINNEVICIDPQQKAVKVRSKEGGEYKEQYDYLVLSPGARAIKPNIEGIDSQKIFTLRNIPDTDRIKTYVSEREIKSAVVIGGGFVGVEMAENLKQKGLEVTLVEAAPHILAPFDTEIVAAVEKELSDNGVKLVLNDGVKEFKDKDSTVEITLTSKAKLEANLVILAIGVIPDTEFLEDSGIQLGEKGHILVNEKMETNLANVFAVGDAIEVVDFINKQNSTVPLAGPANKQGRIAADNIAGLGTTYQGTQGTSIIKVFKLTAACTGNNEKTLNKLNIPNRTVTIHPFSHATYYPGAQMLTLKLIFSEAGKILGAQGVGNEGVDKRIDVIATVIRLGGTIKDLTELELCYAPPFSSARDPVNLAGYVAENVLAGRVETLTAEQLMASKKEDMVLLDVRTVKEVSKKGYIEGAINIPIDSLRKRIEELDKSKEIIAYCQIGLRGYVASRFLSQHGFKVKNVDGGHVSFLRSNYNSNR
ncbi:FAD-dependent oxidoreductase [Desulfosporosinus sp.]|uniref:FAD-dependent oxidoreductase n=1 Tax=Desulfosporosinus sp. TaxID=157907 RepID=UPI0025C5F26A|nr:FAD-dependent oxidoreductase [Desulfosporosinus sp.]MBC2723001.1 FAD-dependent oxidoreductase [Desulfosporosinus sp.]MBC2728058.1 FAD-dependent oxidoreductase [Desulfosporosinus sp.]